MAALDVVQNELHQSELEVAPLAHPGEPQGDDVLLAGCFEDAVAEDVARLVEDAGGEVVVDIDERWTSMNSSASKCREHRSGAVGRRWEVGWRRPDRQRETVTVGETGSPPPRSD